MIEKYTTVYIGDLELDLIPDTDSTLEAKVTGNVIISCSDKDEFLKELTRLIVTYQV